MLFFHKDSASCFASDEKLHRKSNAKMSVKKRVVIIVFIAATRIASHLFIEFIEFVPLIWNDARISSFKMVHFSSQEMSEDARTILSPSSP